MANPNRSPGALETAFYRGLDELGSAMTGGTIAQPGSIYGQAASIAEPATEMSLADELSKLGSEAIQQQDRDGHQQDMGRDGL